MKKSQIFTVVLIISLTFLFGVGQGNAQGVGSSTTLSTLGTGFTYQGQLKNSAGSPITSTCAFQFSLWNALSGPTQLGGLSTVTGVSVANGSFTAQVNAGGEFGATAFNGEARWLGIAVKCSGDSAYNPLAPRQSLTPTPYALALPGLYTQPNATSPNLIGGYSGNSIAAGIIGATISGGGEAGSPNTATDNFGTVGGGDSNTSGFYSTVGGGSINTASGNFASVGGGEINTAGGKYATIPGGYSNMAPGDFSFAAGNQAIANNNGTFVWADSTAADFVSTASNQFLIRAGGGVGINTNTTSPNNLTVNGQVVAGGTAAPADTSAFVSQGLHSGISMVDQEDPSYGSWNIAPDYGDLIFVHETPTIELAGLDISSTGIVSIFKLNNGGGNNPLCVNTFYQVSYCSSSLRYKDNVATLSMGLDTIAKLRPVTFDWKSTGEHDLGFVAEEVNKVSPLLITRNADGQIEGVKYDQISAVLVNGMQEQQAQIAALKAQNASLDARLSALEQGKIAGSASASPLSTPWPWLALVTIILGGLALLKRQGGRP